MPAAAWAIIFSTAPLSGRFSAPWPMMNIGFCLLIAPCFTNGLRLSGPAPR